MSRYTNRVLAALLTFAVGVFISSLSRRFLPELTRFGATTCPSRQINGAACNEWEKTYPVTQGLGWDLSYTSLLHNNGVGPGGFYCEIGGVKPQPPVQKHFAEWKGKPIVSSILLEL